MPETVLPITAIIITRNEETAVQDSIRAASFCEEIIVVDSYSTDNTAGVAESLGATVIQFKWNGRYPKKKQWSLEHPSVSHEWVFLLDADEVISEELKAELESLFHLNENMGVAAYDIPLEYYFSGRPLKHGHRVVKRCLLNRNASAFPEVGDLEAPGITEVEGHYQPVARGLVKRTSSKLLHHDPDPLASWIDRHNRYSDWEAYLEHHQVVKAAIRDRRSRQGKVFDRMPFKSALFFFYSFVLRGGFLDGRAGFDYSFALSFYYWSIGAKKRELDRKHSSARVTTKRHSAQ